MFFFFRLTCVVHMSTHTKFCANDKLQIIFKSSSSQLANLNMQTSNDMECNTITIKLANENQFLDVRLKFFAGCLQYF